MTLCNYISVLELEIKSVLCRALPCLLGLPELLRIFNASIFWLLWLLFFNLYSGSNIGPQDFGS